MRVTTRSNALIAGACMVAFLVGAVYLSLTASRGLPGQDHRVVKVAFPSVGGLRVGDDVRKASVRVGQVRSIDLEGDQAIATLQLDADEVVYRDASAAVQSRSALGQNFVELDAGTSEAGPMPDGGAVESARATAPTNLDEVLSTFDPETRSAVASTLREVGGGLSGHSTDLHDLTLNADEILTDLGSVSGTLGAEPTDLDGLLQATNTLASRFRGREAQVAALTRNLSETLSAVGVDEAKAVEQTLRAAPGTLEKARTALVSLQTPLTHLDRAMTAIRPGATALGQATPDLRGLLVEAVTPLAKVPSVAKQAKPAVASLRDLMADARPLAPRLEDTLASAHEPAAVLAPYAPEISRFFTYWVSANRFSDASGNYLRIGLVIRPESVSGVLPIKDPFVHRNAYPAPGQAPRDRATSILGGS